MKTQYSARKITAMLLTLAMLISCMSAWATTETATVEVDATAADQVLTIEAIDIDEDTPAGDRIIGLDVTVDGHTADVEVQEGIDVDGENAPGGSLGVEIAMEGDNGAADISVGEDISVTDPKRSGGMIINAGHKEGNEITVDVDGSVTAETTAASADGYPDAVGVVISPAGSTDTSIEVEIGEDIKAKGGKYTTGLRMTSEVPVEENGTTVDVHVSGDVVSETADVEGSNAMGLNVESSGAEQETIRVDGTVQAAANDTGVATGISADSWDSGNGIDIDVGGNVTAVSGDETTAVRIVNEDDGTISVDAEGAMLTSSTGKTTAVDIENKADGTVTVGAEKIEASTNSEENNGKGINVAKGVQISSEGGTTSVTAGEGGITARDAGEGAVSAVEINGGDGTVTVKSEGMITGESQSGEAGAVGINVTDNTSVDVSAEGFSAVAKGEEEASLMTIRTENDASVTIHAGEEGMTATAQGNATGVEIRNDEGSTEVISDDTVKAASMDGNAKAVTIQNLEGGSVTVSADQIEAAAVSGDGKNFVFGAVIHSEGDGQTSVTAGDGGITATDGGKGNVSALEINGGDGTVTVKSEGGISGESQSGRADAAGINVTGDTAVDVSAEGFSAETRKGDDASALTIRVEDEASVKITAGEEGISASAKGDENGAAFGVQDMQYDGTVEITSVGDISAETTGEGNGIARAADVSVFDEGTLKISTEGSITATTAGEGEADALTVALFGADAEIQTGKDITADTRGITLTQNQAMESAEMTEAQYEAVKDKAYHAANGPANVLTYKDWENNTEYTFSVNPDGTLGSGTVTRYYDQEATATVTVGGSVIVENDAESGGYTTGVGLTSENAKAKTGIEVGQDIDVQGKNQTYGVNAKVTAGEAAIETGGDITAQSETSADAIHAEIRGTGSLTVHVGGGVKAATTGEERSEGAAMTAQMTGGTLKAEIDGDVTADRIGISVRDYGNGDDDPSVPPKGDVSVNVHGDITVNARGGSTDTEALNLYNSNENGKMEATVDGNVSITGDEYVEAIGLSANGGVIKVKTGGDISAIAADVYGTGVNAGASEGGELELEIDGGIYASAVSSDKGAGGAVGLSAGANGADSKVTITVAKDVTAVTKNRKESSTAILAYNPVEEKKSGELEIKVEGNVKSTGKAISVTGSRFGDEERETVWLDGTAEVREEEYLRTEYRTVEDHNIEGYKVYYNAEGDYYYNEYGDKWQEAEAEEGLTRIEVKGDVTGEDMGLYVNAQALTDVIVDGTLEGGNHAVVIADESIEDNLTLTVWEIKPNDDGSVAEMGRMDENGEYQTTESDAVEQRIQYIIRLEQPEAGGTLSTNGTFDYEGYTVAHESDNVVLKVNLEEGYEIVDAFNGTDTKVSLLKNEEGEYYLVVPRGGAVLLSVELRKIEPEEPDKEEQEEKEETEPADEPEEPETPDETKEPEESDETKEPEEPETPDEADKPETPAEPEVQTEQPAQQTGTTKKVTTGTKKTGNDDKSEEPAEQHSETVAVTIDPNGGMLLGSTESLVRNVTRDSEFTLPEAPEKDGETFLGWYCTEYPMTDARWTAPEEGSSELLEAGSIMKVTQDCFLTAIWKQAE